MSGNTTFSWRKHYYSTDAIFNTVFNSSCIPMTLPC